MTWQSILINFTYLFTFTKLQLLFVLLTNSFASCFYFLLYQPHNRYGQRIQSNPSYLHWQSLMQKMHLKAEVAFIVLASFNDVAQDQVCKSRSGCMHDRHVKLQSSKTAWLIVENSGKKTFWVSLLTAIFNLSAIKQGLRYGADKY